MANLRNEFEFRSALLTALGQEHTEAEAKNEEMWRRKMLDGLGVEYNQNDVNQFGLFREKLIEGVTNYSEGGGGSSDFSTAEVTITNATSEDMISSGFACYNENEAGEGAPSMTLNMLMIPKGETVIFKVPLYKGIAYWNNPFAVVGRWSTTTGNVLNESGNFTITGDGTITLQPPSSSN